MTRFFLVAFFLELFGTFFFLTVFGRGGVSRLIFLADFIAEKGTDFCFLMVEALIDVHLPPIEHACHPRSSFCSAAS